LVIDADKFINNWSLVQANPGPANTGRLLENGAKPEAADEDAPGEHHEEEDGPWYFGKAKEEFHKRRGQASNARREEEDPIQVRGYL
jgi:SEL1 protein